MTNFDWWEVDLTFRVTGEIFTRQSLGSILTKMFLRARKDRSRWLSILVCCNQGC